MNLPPLTPSSVSPQHTETLNIVFLIYFRILKKAQKSVLLPAVLEGLAKYDTHAHTQRHRNENAILTVMSLPVSFAHLINLEFFDDLLNVLQKHIQSGVSIISGPSPTVTLFPHRIS